MKWIAAGVVLALALCGCGTYAWDKPGASSDQLVQDRAECDRQARLMASQYEPALPGPYAYQAQTLPQRKLADEQQAFATCMRAKGYRYVKESRG